MVKYIKCISDAVMWKHRKWLLYNLEMALHYALPVKSDTPEFEIQISKMAMHYAVLVQMCNPSDEMITQTKCKIHIG